MTGPVLSAGVVIFRREPAKIGNGSQILLLRAYRDWDFPKGRVEPGEQPFDAAQREVREETGISLLQFPWGREYRETAPYAKGKIARYYLACCDDTEVRLPVNPELGRPEHHEFRWVDCQTAATMVAARLQPILAWACDKARFTGEGAVLD